MNHVARVASPQIGAKWTAGQLSLIRDTVAKKLSPRMFDQFIESAARLNLDPLKKQIIPIVFNKRELDANTNKWGSAPYLTLVTTIDGYRAIAARTGDYRPDNRPPRYVFDEAAKNPDTNPLGIVSCEVSVFKFSHGEWHEHPAIAFWDEYVPLKGPGRKSSFDDLDGGDGNAASSKVVIDPGTQWARRARGMIAKVAEALALRRAWPEDLASAYVEEEMDAARIIEGELIDVSPSEQAEQADVERRLEVVRSKDMILIDWLEPNAPLETVPLGKLADRLMAFVQENRDAPTVLASFRDRNVHSLREFWAKSPSDALAVRHAFDNAISAARAAAAGTGDNDREEAAEHAGEGRT